MDLVARSPRSVARVGARRRNRFVYELPPGAVVHIGGLPVVLEGYTAVSSETDLVGVGAIDADLVDVAPDGSFDLARPPRDPAIRPDGTPSLLLTEADAAADLAGTPRPDNPTVPAS